jgi:hypothetical protein
MIWSDSYNCLAFQSLIRKYFLWIRILQFTFASSDKFFKSDPGPEAKFFHEILNFYKKIETLFSDDHIGPSVPRSDKKRLKYPFPPLETIRKLRKR